jgi:hypothetical protein
VQSDADAKAFGTRGVGAGAGALRSYDHGMSPAARLARNAVSVRHVSRRSRTPMGPWRSVLIRPGPRRWLLVALR